MQLDAQAKIMRCTEPLRSVVFLMSLVVLKIVLQAANYSRGFISVSFDEFSRGIRAAEWALRPRVDILADMKDVWLPLEKYLNGLLLLVWPDVIRAPRFTVFIASCLVLIALYVLTYFLFDSFLTAALAAVFIVFQPWYTWLSGTPMLEMYYLSCFLAGMVFLLIWLRAGCRGYWFWAGCCFMLASGFHVQSWTLINLVNLLTLGWLIAFIKQKRYASLWRLVGFYVLGNVLIITFSVVEFLNTGRMFAFLANHTAYSKWVYGGYNVALAQKLVFYPQLVIQHSSGAVWALTAVALAFLLRDRANKWRLLPLTVAALALGLHSAMNVVSVPPTAAPARYSLIYVLLASPYLAYGVCRLLTSGAQWPSRRAAYALALSAAALFMYSVWWGMIRLPDFPRTASQGAIETGRRLNRMLGRNQLDEMRSYMVELRYWDFLAVELTAGHFDATVYDREFDLFNRDTPSIFSGKAEDVYAILKSKNARYIALHDPDLKANAQRMDFLRQAQDIDDWTIYEFLPDQQRSPGRT